MLPLCNLGPESCRHIALHARGLCDSAHGATLSGYVHTVPANETECRRKCPDRASVHTRNAACEAVSVPEHYCSFPLLKVERSVSDRFLKRSESSLNTSIGAEIATEPRFGK